MDRAGRQRDTPLRAQDGAYAEVTWAMGDSDSSVPLDPLGALRRASLGILRRVWVWQIRDRSGDDLCGPLPSPSRQAIFPRLVHNP